MKKLIAGSLLLAALAGAVSLAGATGPRDAGPLAPGAVAPASASPAVVDLCTFGPNLLQNPSFEGDYSAYVPPNGHPDCPLGICTTAQMAAGWLPWWRSNSGPGDYDRNPEYKAATLFDLGPTGTPGERVHSGERAQQYFSFYGTHVAGIYQQVAVMPGRTYRFCVWGHSWSAGEYEDYENDPPTIPDTDFVSGPQFGEMLQRVGIDPLGGDEWPVDGAGTNIVWGPAREQYDYWGQFSVDVTAQASTLTVYTFSDPMWAVRNNDVYWDDAALIELASATMSVSPAGGLHFVADVATPRVMTQTLSIAFDPDQAFSWAATVEPGGTFTPTILPATGLSADPLTVTVDTTGLAAGDYAASVVILGGSGAMGGSPATVPLTLAVAVDLRETYLPVWFFSP